MTMTGLGRLFEELPSINLAGTVSDIACGERAMLETEVPTAAIEQDTEVSAWYWDLIRQAAEAMCVVVHGTRTVGGERYSSVFVVRQDQLWRVSAYTTFRDTHSSSGGRWSDEAELYEKTLLGVPASIIATWMTNINEAQSGWGMSTVYLLLPEGTKERLAQTSHRCLAPVFRTGIVAFRHRDDAMRIKCDAMVDLVGLELGRVGISHSMDLALFESSLGADGSVLAVELTASMMEGLDRSLEAGIEFFENGKWNRL